MWIKRKKLNCFWLVCAVDALEREKGNIQFRVTPDQNNAKYKQVNQGETFYNETQGNSVEKEVYNTIINNGDTSMADKVKLQQNENDSSEENQKTNLPPIEMDENYQKRRSLSVGYQHQKQTVKKIYNSQSELDQENNGDGTNSNSFENRRQKKRKRFTVHHNRLTGISRAIELKQKEKEINFNVQQNVASLIAFNLLQKMVENHNVIGIQGIIPQHRANVEELKLHIKMEDELYLRQHPELGYLISLFMRQVLEEKPANGIQFAGKFFDRSDLKQLVDKEIANMQGHQEEEYYKSGQSQMRESQDKLSLSQDSSNFAPQEKQSVTP